jgi:hypothetical protein
VRQILRDRNRNPLDNKFNVFCAFVCRTVRLEFEKNTEHYQKFVDIYFTPENEREGVPECMVPVEVINRMYCGAVSEFE